MTMAQAVSRSFVLLRPGPPLATVRRQISASPARYVVVRGRGGAPTEGWYLIPMVEARAALAAAPDARDLPAAIGLEWRSPATTVDVDSLDDAVPDGTVVLDDGRLIGVVDRRPDPSPPDVDRSSPRRAGAGRRGARRSVAAVRSSPAAEGVRSLEADFPARIPAGSTGRLMIWVAVGTASIRGVALDLPAGETLDIVVQARRGFAVAGKDHGRVRIPDEGESLPMMFELKAVDVGRGTIRIVAFHDGEAVGAITLSPEVVKRSTRRSRAAAAPAESPVRGAATLAPGGPVAPDLLMLILQSETGGRTSYRILLNALDPALRLNYRSFGPFELRLDPAAFFDDFFRQVDELPLDTDEDRAYAQRQLERKGAYLSEQLLPEDLRQALWQVRDRIGSVIVQSEEPWIPWELCRLVGREEGRIREDAFLCEKYAIARWRPSVDLKRPLTLRRLALVVPSDSELPQADDERMFVQGLAGPNREVLEIPASFEAVSDAFVDGTYDGWHFVAHGVAEDRNADRAELLLEGEVPLTPEDVSGQAANVGLARPLVFVNACQLGRGGHGLTGIGGWANRFVEAGAAAFIGAAWSVNDGLARDFAVTLYDELLKGAAIGDAVRSARHSIRRDGDPTWLAYTLFADPLATLAD